MAGQALGDQTAIVGIGWTAFNRSSGTSAINLAAEATLMALADAGLPASALDGVVTFRWGLSQQQQLHPLELINALALDNCRFESFGNLGGTHCCSTVATAASAVHSGLCDYALVFVANNGHSDRVVGAWSDVRGPRQWDVAAGGLHAAAQYGPPVVAHMARYGTTNRDLGEIAVRTRAHAALNTKAMMREPLTIEAHQASPWIVYPYRLFDCCQQTDGAVALIVTSVERARDLRQAPVVIMSAGGAVHHGRPKWETAAERTAPALYGAAGITVGDLDFAQLYDPFTGMCLLHVEGFGLAPPGEGAAWVAAGGGAIDGETPLNTHGGLLSEGHLHGLNGILEAVQQLRPQGVVDDLCDGDHDYDRTRCRQIRDPEIGLVCGEMGGSALILRKD